jgi:hypothetical protein
MALDNRMGFANKGHSLGLHVASLQSKEPDRLVLTILQSDG